MNKELIRNIDIFINKLSLTPLIMGKLKELLIRYDYCKLKGIYHYPIEINDKNYSKFVKHLIGFIDGDGAFRSGSRVGHRSDRFRFTPDVAIKLIEVDKDYLQSVKNNLLCVDGVKVYSTSNNQALLMISTIPELEILIKLIDSHEGFLSQKRSRDFLLFKNLIEFLNKTKNEIHDNNWKLKGLKLLGDFNSYL